MVKGILGIQILGMLFSIIMIYFTFLHYKRNDYKVEGFFLWLALWIGFMFMVVFPTSLDFFIKGVLKFGRRLDFFIVLGFIFLLGMTYYNHYIVKKNNRKVEKVVRAFAFRNKK